MITIEMPLIQAISEENRNYIRYFDEKLGHVPNLYLSMMHSNHAFRNFYRFHGRKTSLSLKEREAINLVMAQLNNSLYCLSAHTMIAKLNGFSEEEIMQLRNGKANFDTKLATLARLVKSMAVRKGKNITNELNAFFDAGYTKEHLLDVLETIGESYMSNFMAKTMQVPLDFPEAPVLKKNDEDENDDIE